MTRAVDLYRSVLEVEASLHRPFGRIRVTSLGNYWHLHLDTRRSSPAHLVAYRLDLVAGSMGTPKPTAPVGHTRLVVTLILWISPIT